MGRTILILLATLAILTSPAAAAELAGVTLPDRESVEGTELVLNGMGLREATFLRVDVYVAGLYLEQKTDDPAAIINSNAAKKLVMRFVRSVGRKDLVEAWTDGFKKNAPDFQGAENGLRALNAAMVDVGEGDSLEFVQTPGGDIVLTVKGKAADPITGEPFARALWSVWLGPKPPNPELKEGLLGRQ